MNVDPNVTIYGVRANVPVSVAEAPEFSVSATMVLAQLGEIDAAFAVAEGYLLRRGPLVGSLFRDAGQMAINDHAWRRTMFIFTPATAAMRADPRFRTLCDGIGLTDYWNKRGIRPDLG